MGGGGGEARHRLRTMRHKRSEYMHWAKTQSRARYNLATSGVASRKGVGRYFFNCRLMSSTSLRMAFSFFSRSSDLAAAPGAPGNRAGPR